MQTVELKDHSLASLFAIIESQPGNYRNLFRGQANASWGLVPSLYRVKNVPVASENLEKNYDLFETGWINSFFDEGLNFLPRLMRTYSNDRILAQHFGVPTRLLDWTRDPLVAIYFAVENPQSDVDAAVYMILPEAKHRPEDVRSLGPHRVIELTPPAIDARILAQKSVFTFHPYGPPDQPFVPLDERDEIGGQIAISEDRERGFTKIVIPSRLTGYLRSTLHGMGYDRAHLFPGLDGVGANIGVRARAGGLWN